MQFEKITGQQELKKQLVEMVQHNRLSHALLFLSKEGSGALQLAKALAQSCHRTLHRYVRCWAFPKFSFTINCTVNSFC